MELTTQEYCHKRLINYIRLKGYSINTLTVYKSTLEIILRRFPEPDKTDLLDIQDFAITFKNEHTRKNICVIIRWLFNTVYNKNISWKDLPFPSASRKIQPIYSQEDIYTLLKSIVNPKQKAMFALIADNGLRISEPCDILLTDCNSKNRSVVLRRAKGKKDRIVYPSEFVWTLIRIYWKSLKEKPNTYLFEGQIKGNPYTPTSIRAFVKHYCKKSGVKYIGVHSIRRFTGSWQVENKVPETVVAYNLGHSGTVTLQKHYLIHSPNYLKNIISPLTQIQL